MILKPGGEEGENEIKLKEGEKALKESEARLRSIFKAAPVGIGLVSRRILKEVNDRLCRMTGYPAEELVGQSARILYPTDEDYEYVGREKYRQITLRGTGTVETRWKRKDGRVIDVLLSSTPRDPDDLVNNVTFTALDITDRKLAEEKLKASLKEKEVLLREVHHRTKNNMAVISALVSLQASHIQDPELLQVFRETENRIKAMALVHEKLYQSANLSDIDLGNYLKDLTHQIFRTYRTEDQCVHLEMDLDPATVTLDTAIPCGLILNELLSNSFKHGFKGRKEGRIRLELSSSPSGEIRMAFSDDGNGLPPDLDVRQASSLGLQLVVNLAESQLSGRLELHRQDGTQFVLFFKESRKP